MDNEYSNLEEDIRELNSQVSELSYQLSSLKKALKKLERLNAGIRYNGSAWEAFDSKGVLATDRTVVGVMERI